MKEQESIVEAFNEMAPRYENLMNSELKRFWGWSYAEFADVLLNKIKIQANDTILDVATGTSYLPARLIQEHKDLKQIVGLDITLGMLRNGKKRLISLPGADIIEMLCASALAMPLSAQFFDVILCGLATHHMDVKVLLAEMHRLLKPEGTIAILDVGGSPSWKNPLVKLFIRVLAFVYFFITENKSRAWAEASALTNIRTSQEWRADLLELGFNDFEVSELQSRKIWVPNPLVIYAKK